MTERDIFTAALQMGDPAERQAYLDEACARQPGLRQQVENLLRLHEGAGSFLETPAVPEVIEELAGQAFDRATQAEAAGGDGEDISLDFLAPSQRPGSLGRLGHYEVQEVIG